MKLSLDQAMKLAIEEALKGAPLVSPNPKVGCVVLDRQGQLLSKGFHSAYGKPHAEVEALKNLSSEQLKGSHVIVTLEPCAHEGKTPSCAKMLATLPISKVTYGLQDPNPLVSGQGAEIIRAAGIQAELYQGSLEKELQETCEEFLWNFLRKEIFVALKVAQSLDGRIALPNGKSQWITGPESRLKAHELRACYDAVLVGKNTVLMDNPGLNVRHPEIQKQNKVIILDSYGVSLKREKDLRVFQIHDPENIYVVVKKGFLLKSNKARIVEADSLIEALEKLYSHGLRSVMVEGGGQVLSSFLVESRAQRLHIFTAPLVLGQGKSWTEGLSFSQMENRLRLLNPRTQQLGMDFYMTARLPES